jgi:hypothetical protein
MLSWILHGRRIYPVFVGALRKYGSNDVNPAGEALPSRPASLPQMLEEIFSRAKTKTERSLERSQV